MGDTENVSDRAAWYDRARDPRRHHGADSFAEGPDGISRGGEPCRDWRDITSSVEKSVGRSICPGCFKWRCFGCIASDVIRHWDGVRSAARSAALWIYRWNSLVGPDLSGGSIPRPASSPQFVTGRDNSQCHFDGVDHVHHLDY